jgi:hypothetical protein
MSHCSLTVSAVSENISDFQKELKKLKGKLWSKHYNIT